MMMLILSWLLVQDGTANTSEEVQVPHFNMPFCTDQIKALERGQGFFTEEFSQKEKMKNTSAQLFKISRGYLSTEQEKETLSSNLGYTRFASFSKMYCYLLLTLEGNSPS